MDLSIIIVNYNTKKLLEKCLTSIYRYTPMSRHSEPFDVIAHETKQSQGKLREESRSLVESDLRFRDHSDSRNSTQDNGAGVKSIKFEVIVVDNGSKDGSQDLVKRKFPKANLILNKYNLGFTKANNQGIKIAKGKYILLLNSDTYLIENSLEKLVKKARSLPKLGALGPLLLNEDKTIQQSVGFFPNLPQVFFWMTFIDNLPGGTFLKPYHVDHDRFYRTDRQVDWMTAAAILVPKAVANKVGILDEAIFMYGEEVDWCYRIKQAGYNVYFSCETKIVHIGRGSSNKISENAIVGEYKGILYFYKKYKGASFLQIVHLLLKIGALARILIFTILGRKELTGAYEQALKVA